MYDILIDLSQIFVKSSIIVNIILKLKIRLQITVAPMAWVPWVPGNPSIFEQWFPQPIRGRNHTKNPVETWELAGFYGVLNVASPTYAASHQFWIEMTKICPLFSSKQARNSGWEFRTLN